MLRIFSCLLVRTLFPPTLCVAGALLLCGLAATPASGQLRSLGIDVSYWQGTMTQTTWNNIRNLENREYVFIRSSRGGTTGIDQRQGGFSNNTIYNGSQRYDDPRFIQNMVRSTNAGLFAGPYHFARPDIIASTQNSDGSLAGVANTGLDEANHFLQMAGPYMRPGFLLPVFDLEAGQQQRTRNELAQFSIDFANRIHQQTGVYPIMYINGNYANYLQGASQSLRDTLVEVFPHTWYARYANQADPDSIPVQTGHPKDTFTPIYGPWDDYGDEHPWSFWQYASTGRLQSHNNGNSNLDFNVAQGGIEFVKDHLVPAIWLSDSDGNWNDLANWNSGQPVVAPVPGPGQITPAQSGPLPEPRLPGGAAPGSTSGIHDTVILDRPNANVTVTLSSGIHNIRKLYAREALNLTGGSLTINYVPSWDSSPYSARFSAPVTMSGNAGLHTHTIHVDAAQNFTATGTLTFDTILLNAGASPAKITMGGNLIVVPQSGATATISSTVAGRGGNTGFIDLGGATRTFTVSNGSADIDLSVDVQITNGGLTKNGGGTMQVTSANSYTGNNIISAGRMLVNNTTGSGLGTGTVLVGGNGVLGGTGSVAGAVTMNLGGTIAPGMSAGTLTVGEITFNSGSNFDVEIGGLNPGSQHDVLAVTGSATLGGSLNLSLLNNFVPTLGDSFTVLTADDITGSFDSLLAPSLDEGTWGISYLSDSVVLSVISGIPGDFNNDGLVDGADLAVWEANFGMLEGAGAEHGDAVGNGKVDGMDFLIWQRNFGANGLTASATAVPEPGTGALLLLAALAFATRRRIV